MTPFLCAGCAQPFDRYDMECCDGKWYCVACYPKAWLEKDAGQTRKLTGAP